MKFENVSPENFCLTVENISNRTKRSVIGEKIKFFKGKKLLGYQERTNKGWQHYRRVEA